MPSPNLFEVFVIFISVFGTVNNVLFVTTIISIPFKSKLTNSLLINQCICDASASLIYVLIKYVPSLKPTSITVINKVICHLWDSQVLFWFFIMASVQTLLWIGLDRYIAILHPVHYRNHAKQLIIASHIWIYTISPILGIPSAFHCSVVNETCQSIHTLPDDYYKVHLKIYSISWYCFIYLGPIISFIIIYYKIIVFIHKNSKENLNQRMKRSTVIFTITTIVITIQFALFVFLDASYYVASSFEIFNYVYYGTVEEVGVLLLLISCIMNPIICMITMKIRRQLCLKVFLFCLHRQSMGRKVYPNNTNR